MESIDYNNSSISEEELWIQYKKMKDSKIREHFIIKYAPLVKYVAGKVAIGKPGNVEYDDLVGFGTFGLIDAIEKFDPQKNVKFKTYAVTRIRGAILDELRSFDPFPRTIRQMAKAIERAIQSIESKVGRAATDQEIADELNWDLPTFYTNLTKVHHASNPIYLTQPFYTGDDNDKLTIIDTIESSPSLNPDVLAEKEEVKDLIVNAINDLPDKEKKVLVLYYYEELTLKEIGDVLDVTESRVSQLHTKALMRLKGKLAEIKESIY